MTVRRNNVLTIMKKELRRFFGDRRMLLTIILPGLLHFGRGSSRLPSIRSTAAYCIDGDGDVRSLSQY